MQTQLVNFTIPKKILRQADKAAFLESRSRSELFREAIRRYLNERAEEKKDFARIRRSAASINLSEEEAIALVDKARDELPINQ